MYVRTGRAGTGGNVYFDPDHSPPVSTILLLCGLFVGTVAPGLVYADAVRRDLPGRARRLWTGATVLVSVGGFTAAFRRLDALYRLYLDATGGPAIAPLPREVATAVVVVALAAAAAAVLAYGFGSRYGPLKAAGTE